MLMGKPKSLSFEETQRGAPGSPGWAPCPLQHHGCLRRGSSATLGSVPRPQAPQTLPSSDPSCWLRFLEGISHSWGGRGHSSNTPFRPHRPSWLQQQVSPGAPGAAPASTPLGVPPHAPLGQPLRWSCRMPGICVQLDAVSM